MVCVRSCGREASERRYSLLDTELMRQTAGYNDIGCKGLMEVVRYLRQYHIPQPSSLVGVVSFTRSYITTVTTNIGPPRALMVKFWQRQVITSTPPLCGVTGVNGSSHPR